MRTSRNVFLLSLCALGMIKGQSAWVVDSLQRIGPTDAVGSGSSISLYAAKGESESLQVIVHAPFGGLTINNVTASNLTGPSGAVIPSSDVALYREFYVDVTAPSPDFGQGNRPQGAGWYPDPLIPFVNPATGQPLSGATYDAVPYVAPSNQNVPFWIDINVPRTATAGNYAGTITVSTPNESFSVGVSLRVWNFTLPVAPTLKTSFGLHTTLTTAANNQVLLANRIQPFVVRAADFSSLVPSGVSEIGLPYYNQSSGCAIDTPPTEASLLTSMKTFPAGYPTYIYPADEVNGCANLAQNLQAWAQVAHSAGAKTLVTVTPAAALMNDGTGTGRSDVDYWTLVPREYCSDDQIRATENCVENPFVAEALAKGDQIWSYNEQEQDDFSPKWMLDFAPINYRIFPGFINQRFSFSGMIYSDMARWTSSPWTNVQNWANAGYNFPGDDMLVYPGQQVGLSTIVPSMRLKFIRDGVDDYDYMAMLRAKGQGTFVTQIVNSVAPDWINWTKSTSALQNARVQLGNELDALSGGTGGSGTTVSAPSNPWPVSGTPAAGTNLTMQWSSVSNATQYQLYFGTNSSSLALYATVGSSGTSVTQYKMYHLNSRTTYYWRIVAVTPSGNASSAVWSYTTP